MDGFSDRDVDTEVGHLYGLRWFQLTLTDHEITHVEGTIERVTGQCRCGAPYDGPYYGLPNWVTAHSNGSEVGLKGAWGPWQPGENVARCHTHGELHAAPPVRGCKCGFWAYWKLGNQMTGDPHVVAIVKGYGDIIEGDLGFRASHAKIVAMFLPGWSHTAAFALEARYGDVYSTLGAMLLRHPAPPGQPVLLDDYYVRQAALETATIPGAQPGWGGGDGGWNRDKESALDYARRLGLASPLSPCRRCGTEDACGTGVYFCGPCKLMEARSAQAATMSGADALTELHHRREGWVGGGGGATFVLRPGHTVTFGPSNVTGVSGGGGGGGGGYTTTPPFARGGSGGSGPPTASGSFTAPLTPAQIDRIKKMFGF